MLKVLVLGTFLILELMNSLTSAAFDSFEHRYIADEAFDAVFRANAGHLELRSRNTRDILGFTPFTVPPFTVPPSSDISEDPLDYFITRLPVSFGDLAALAGDFVETPSKLDRLLYKLNDSLYHRSPRSHPTFIALRRQWLNACTWIRNSKGEVSQDTGDTLIQDPNSCMKQYLQAEDVAIKKELGFDGETQTQYFRSSQGYEPSRLENADFEKTDGYVSIARANSSHFPIESWNVYRSNHKKALIMAACYATLTSFDQKGIEPKRACDVEHVERTWLEQLVRVIEIIEEWPNEPERVNEFGTLAVGI